MSSSESEGELFDARRFEKRIARDARRVGIAHARSLSDRVREFGGWTLNKLEVLDLYLKQYRRVAGNGTYIDGFAGAGPVLIDGVTRHGSAARALDSGAFKSLLLYELPETADKLQSYIESEFRLRHRRRCIFRHGDFNKLVIEDLRSEVIPKSKPCFAFLDPDSTQLAWETVEHLAACKADGDPPKSCKIELWILVNTHQAWIRLVPKRPEDGFAQSDEAATLDRVFGGRTAWWDLSESGSGPGLYAARYAQRLEQLGYAYARPHRILDPKTGKPQYYMIQASDHPAAVSFMRWAEREAAASRHGTPPIPGLE